MSESYLERQKFLVTKFYFKNYYVRVGMDLSIHTYIHNKAQSEKIISNDFRTKPFDGASLLFVVILMLLFLNF